MSTEINKQLFVLRHVETQEYVGLNVRDTWHSQFFLTNDLTRALMFEDRSKLPTTLYQRDKWFWAPTPLQFEILEFVLTKVHTCL
jgi:hypothetical protein